MARETTHIRVGRDVEVQLKALAERWKQEGSDLARDWGPAADKMHVSVETVILELLRRDQDHRRRAALQRLRRRSKRLGGGALEGAAGQ